MKNCKFLIIGSAGQLGREFQVECEKKGHNYIAPSEKSCDLSDINQLKNIIDDEKPSHIINCAAYNAVDLAEVNPEKVFLINQHAVAGLSTLCKTNNVFLIHYSSDYVFNGEKNDFYYEDDTPEPLNNYGKSKLFGENEIKKVLTKFLIFRLSWVIGRGKQNFIYKILEWTKDKNILKVSADEVSIPTFTEEIVKITLKAIKDDLTGLYHLTNSGYASRYELAKFFFESYGSEKIIIPVPLTYFNLTTRRPLFSAMSNSALSKKLNIKIPAWKWSLKNYIKKMDI